ncbi:MAG: hypothetical protein AAGP08_06320 [Pseudomonadota bacterium]
MRQRIATPFRRFFKDQSASITVEVVLIMPILLWGYFGMFALFDAYRSLSTNVKASYTLGDMLSRETLPVDEDYINGLNRIQDVITQSGNKTVLRVTVVEYDDNETPSFAGDDFHDLKWSHATDGMLPITEATMEDAILDHLPSMFNGEQLIVVETWVAFVPFLDITTLKAARRDNGALDDTTLDAFYFENLVVTRPRFAGQLCWETCIE